MRCEGVDWRSSVAHSERNALYTHGCRGAERRSQWGKLAEVQRIPQANLLVLSLFGGTTLLAALSSLLDAVRVADRE